VFRSHYVRPCSIVNPCHCGEALPLPELDPLALKIADPHHSQHFEQFACWRSTGGPDFCPASRRRATANPNVWTRPQPDVAARQRTERYWSIFCRVSANTRTAGHKRTFGVRSSQYSQNNGICGRMGCRIVVSFQSVENQMVKVRRTITPQRLHEGLIDPPIKRCGRLYREPSSISSIFIYFPHVLIHEFVA
jgi:hypothetical protein